MKWNFSRTVVAWAMLFAVLAHGEEGQKPVQTNLVVKVRAVPPKKGTAKTPKTPKPPSKEKKDSFSKEMVALEQRVDDILWRCDLMAYSPFTDSILFPYE